MAAVPRTDGVLLDFGIAKLLDPVDGQQRGLPRTGTRLLTPEYARPERRRALKGDLDVILLKAMRPEADERYGSAGALADDLQRHLEGHPIRGRRPSVRYRVRKSARRNPWFPAVAAGLVLATAGYVGTLEVQSRRLQLERNEARVQAERAEQISDFLVDLFRSADPYDAPDPSRSRQVTVVEGLELGAERARTELSDRPLLLADLLSSIATVYERMDLRDPALALFAEAMEIRIGIDTAGSLEQLADLGLTASILARSGQLDSAEVIERKRLTLARAHPDGRHEVASALLGLGSIDQAAARRGESLGPLHSNTLDSLNNLAIVLTDAGDGSGAEQAHRMVLDRRRRIPTAPHWTMASGGQGRPRDEWAWRGPNRSSVGRSDGSPRRQRIRRLPGRRLSGRDTTLSPEERTVLHHSIPTASVIAIGAAVGGHADSLREVAQPDKTLVSAGELADGPAFTAKLAVDTVDSQRPLGAPRDDLQRFYGVYGVAGERRNFLVAEARAGAGEPGHLMVGAMWGDVQPWRMKLLSDTRFEQAYVGQFQDAPLIVEFHTDDDGRAVALTFTGLFDDRGRVERIGDLPEGR